MVMINKDGHVYWAPEGEANANKRLAGASISSFHKWEQAFRIFSHIYVSAHPDRASELTQYSYIIHDAAQAFPWDNVYGYDILFRRHMSKFPAHNWGVILQQALAFKMRPTSIHRSNSDRNEGQRNKSKRDVCWKFNSGKCTDGLSCKFDHRCAFCFKFGHGSHNCRKAIRSVDNVPEHDQKRDNYNDDKRQERNDRYHYIKRDYNKNNLNNNTQRKS